MLHAAQWITSGLVQLAAASITSLDAVSNDDSFIGPMAGFGKVA